MWSSKQIAEPSLIERYDNRPTGYSRGSLPDSLPLKNQNQNQSKYNNHWQGR